MYWKNEIEKHTLEPYMNNVRYKFLKGWNLWKFTILWGCLWSIQFCLSGTLAKERKFALDHSETEHKMSFRREDKVNVFFVSNYEPNGQWCPLPYSIYRKMLGVLPIWLHPLTNWSYSPHGIYHATHTTLTLSSMSAAPPQGLLCWLWSGWNHSWWLMGAGRLPMGVVGVGRPPNHPFIG